MEIDESGKMLSISVVTHVGYPKNGVGSKIISKESRIFIFMNFQNFLYILTKILCKNDE